MINFIYAGTLKDRPVKYLAVPLKRVSHGSYLDRIGIWLSGICMVHCVITPIILVLLPMMTFVRSEWVHLVLACVLPLVAFAAFLPGYRRHQDKLVIALGLIGLSLIIFAAFDPLKILNLITEGLVTSIGSIALISGHLRNRRLNHCDHPHHAHC